MDFKPLGTQVLVEEIELKMPGGILAPKATPEYAVYIVRGVGQGWVSNGQVVPLPLKVGDKVHVKNSAGPVIHPLADFMFGDGKRGRMGVIDVTHLLGVWEGELPTPPAPIVIPRPIGKKLQMA